jgi:cytochrome c oxidase cbb3-type subunit 3
MVALACAALALCACDRERREFSGATMPENGPSDATLVKLEPGASTPAKPDPRGPQYEGNAYHLSQGQRLFRWYNCNGCHSNGGGGMGPPLMDEDWRYGGTIDQIYSTIVQGRPNGMPTFRDKIPEQQIWEIAAYVRSLSGNVPKDAASSREEGVSAIPPLTRIPEQPPQQTDSSAVQQEPQ